MCVCSRGRFEHTHIFRFRLFMGVQAKAVAAAATVLPTGSGRLLELVVSAYISQDEEIQTPPRLSSIWLALLRALLFRHATTISTQSKSASKSSIALDGCWSYLLCVLKVQKNRCCCCCCCWEALPFLCVSVGPLIDPQKLWRLKTARRWKTHTHTHHDFY